MSGVYPCALLILAMGARDYIIICSQRDKLPLTRRESPKLDLFIYSIDLAFLPPPGAGCGMCRIIGYHLRYVRLILVHLGGSARIKSGCFYFVLEGLGMVWGVLMGV